MSIFSKKENEIPLNKNEKEQSQYKNEMKSYFADLCNRVQNMEGSIIKSNGHMFNPTEKYKFYIENDDYYFVYCYEEKYINYYIDHYDDYKFNPIILKHDKYSCSLIDNKNNKVSNEFLGENSYKICPINILFENTSDKNDVITIHVNNNAENISPLSKFYYDLGVRNYYNIINIPATETFQLSAIDGNAFMKNTDYEMWRNNNTITFMRTDQNNVTIIDIPVNDILYYKPEGEIRYEQLISSGKGSGINYGGAVIGGLLFGGAGAIIGSNKNQGSQQIQSKTVTYDTRIITLIFRKDNDIYKISFSRNASLAFDWLIPEKQYDYVISKRRKMYENE